MSRKFASAAGETTVGMLDTMSKGTQAGVGLLTIVGAIIGMGGYAAHRVDAKLGEMDARLSAKMDGLKGEVNATMAGVDKSVDAKVAGLDKSIDARLAGVEKGVDAKVAGVSDKAKAEALMVLKDYGVSEEVLSQSAQGDAPCRPLHHVRQSIPLSLSPALSSL